MTTNFTIVIHCKVVIFIIIGEVIVLILTFIRFIIVSRNMNDNRLVFSGNKNDWLVWRMKFVQFTARNDCLGILNGTESVPSRFPKGDMNLSDEYIREIKAHDSSFGELLVEMEDTKLSLMIGKSVLSINPSVDLRVAWEKLEKKYYKKDINTKLNLQKDIQSKRLTQGIKPNDCFDEMGDIRNQLEIDYDEVIQDKEYVTILINGLDENIYEDVIYLLEVLMEEEPKN